MYNNTICIHLFVSEIDLTKFCSPSKSYLAHSVRWKFNVQFYQHYFTHFWIQNRGLKFWAEKWTPGVHSVVHFINMLWAAFTSADPESAKKTDNLTVFFALFGSACVKALCKHVDEIDYRCRYSITFRASFFFLLQRIYWYLLENIFTTSTLNLLESNFFMIF